MKREELLALMAPKTETVKINGKPVTVAELGATDYVNLWSKHRNPDDSINMETFTPALVAACVVDAKGKRIFRDDDVDVLSKSASSVFFKLADACRKLNGLSGDEQKN